MLVMLEITITNLRLIEQEVKIRPMFNEDNIEFEEIDEDGTDNINR